MDTQVSGSTGIMVVVASVFDSQPKALGLIPYCSQSTCRPPLSELTPDPYLLLKDILMSPLDTTDNIGPFKFNKNYKTNTQNIHNTQNQFHGKPQFSQIPYLLTPQ